MNILKLRSVVLGQNIERLACALGFNPFSANMVGMDIGGTKILLTITDMAGKIISTCRIASTNDLSKISQWIHEVISDANIPESKIVGMGIGVPGTVTPDGTIIGGKSLYWTDFPLRAEMSKFFSFPLYISNDVNCAAMGERWLGAGKNADNLFFIALGTGIGSAIISDGRLLNGAHYRAGEICYFLSREDIDKNNQNIFGEKGVLEKKISGTALNQYGIPSDELFQRYQHGDSKIDNIIRDFIMDLSVTIANVVSLLNPEQVVIGGGVSESMHSVIGEIRQMVLSLTPIQTNVNLASLGSDAGSLGAIAFALDRIIQSSDIATKTEQRIY
jgi:predicted NBD/HSP70 family sugar kinase